MERAPDGFEMRSSDDESLVAANDPVIAEARQPAGWDPFEIWRSRVRNRSPRSPREGRKTTG
jgi:hypothetical protein